MPQMDERKCPFCDAPGCTEEDGDHTFPVGDDFGPDGLPRVTAELTVRVPIIKCAACKGQFLDYRCEYVTEAAAKVWRETRRARSAS